MPRVAPSSADASAAFCGGMGYSAPRLDFSLPARMTLPGAVSGLPAGSAPVFPRPAVRVHTSAVPSLCPAPPFFRATFTYSGLSGSADSLTSFAPSARLHKRDCPRLGRRAFAPLRVCVRRIPALLVLFLGHTLYCCFLSPHLSEYSRFCHTYFTPTFSRYICRLIASMPLSSNASKI